MGASTEQLEREIEQTRQELAGTLDAIGHKVDEMRQSMAPRALIRRRPVQLAGGVVGAFIALRVALRLIRRRHRR